MMKKSAFVLIFAIFLAATQAFAQASLSGDLEGAFRKFKVVRAPADSLQSAAIEGRLRLGDMEINLVPNDLRGKGFRAEETIAGGSMRILPAQPLTTFKGRLAADPGSWARLNISEKGIEGIIASEGRELLIEPASRYSKFAGKDDLVIYEKSEVLHEMSLECGQEHLHGKVEKKRKEGFSGAAPTGGLRVLEIATEADFEYVSLLGGAAQANNEILTILNMVDGVYEAELDLSISVTYQHAWSAPDGYNQVGGMPGFLESFRARWNAAPFSSVNRDLAHVWTNKAPFAGVNAQGRAFSNVVCIDPAYAFSATGRRNEEFAFNINYLLASHEIAHTMSAVHADINEGCGQTIMNQILSNVTPFTFCGFSRGQVSGYIGGASGSCLSPEFTGAAPFDFDGDRKSDIAIFRPSNGVWYISNSGNASFSIFQFGQNGDKPVAADYDGDGKTDAAVFRGGLWYRLKSSNSTFDAVSFGNASDLPAQADFDGDGQSDVAVFRPSDGYWHLLKSGSGYTAFQFGTNGDIPMPGDFDGDGKADPNIFRPANGVWFRLESLSGNAFGMQFGLNGDKPVSGDFDGDAKADMAVFRQGIWYIFFSSTLNFGAQSFGTATDIPTPADFDGDGKTDYGVFRASQGTWYKLLSSNGGFSGFQLGTSTDIPALAR